MTQQITFERLVEIVDGDRELVTILIEHGVIQTNDGFHPADVDRVLTCRTLVREFEVNLPAVDIILRLREQLAKARLRIAQLEDKQLSTD